VTTPASGSGAELLVAEVAGGADVEPPARDRRANDRAALVVMLVAGAAAVPLLMWYGRGQWFFLDEWDFLVNRSAGSLHDLFRSYNGHWSTVPILAYRANFHLWGIRTYVPYQLLIVLAHVALSFALWTLMRHAGVRAWLATGVVIPFLLFGSGYENIIWAFQIGFAGAALCGVTQLVLADHDGPIGWRDWLGVSIGLIGLMCASAAIALTATVGVAVFLRRGWRVAAFHVAPLALAYVVWYAVTGHTSSVPARYSVEALRFARELTRATFMGLGKYAPVAILLVALALVGVWSAVVVPLRERQRPAAALPAALLVGFVLYVALTAVARNVLGASTAASSRYVHVGALFVLPFVALGGEALARRRALLVIVPVALLAIALPRNLSAFDHRNALTTGRGVARIIAVAPYSALFDAAPADDRYAETGFGPQLAPTAGWLRAARASGRLPTITDPPPELVLRADGDLALQQRRGSEQPCVRRVRSARVHLERGDRVRFERAVQISVVRGRSSSPPFLFDPAGGHAVVDVAGPIDVVVTTATGTEPAVCAPAAAR
jgi:hypothetical protein